MISMKKIPFAALLAFMCASNSLWADILPTFKLWNRWDVPIWFRYDNDVNKSPWRELKPGKSYSTTTINTGAVTTLYISIGEANPTDPRFASAEYKIYRYEIPKDTNIYVYSQGIFKNIGQGNIGLDKIPLYKQTDKLALGPLALKKNIQKLSIDPQEWQAATRGGIPSGEEPSKKEPAPQPRVMIGQQRTPQARGALTQQNAVNSFLFALLKKSKPSTQENIKDWQQKALRVMIGRVNSDSPFKIENDLLIINPFDLLNISVNANAAEIKNAYQTIQNALNENAFIDADIKKKITEKLMQAYTNIANPYINLDQPLLIQALVNNKAILIKLGLLFIENPDAIKIEFFPDHQNTPIKDTGNELLICPERILGLDPSKGEITLAQAKKAYDDLITKWKDYAYVGLGENVLAIIKKAFAAIKEEKMKHSIAIGQQRKIDRSYLLNYTKIFDEPTIMKEVKNKEAYQAGEYRLILTKTQPRGKLTGQENNTFLINPFDLLSIPHKTSKQVIIARINQLKENINKDQSINEATREIALATLDDAFTTLLNPLFNIEPVKEYIRTNNIPARKKYLENPDIAITVQIPQPKKHSIVITDNEIRVNPYLILGEVSKGAVQKLDSNAAEQTIKERAEKLLAEWRIYTRQELKDLPLHEVTKGEYAALREPVEKMINDAQNILLEQAKAQISKKE